MINASTATAADFKAVARRHAEVFLWWALIAVIIGWLASPLWALPLIVLAGLQIVRLINCALTAHALRHGTYRGFNINNGAPDGDAANWYVER